MNVTQSAIAARKPYSPPAATRVYVDPVRELLLATACVLGVNDPGVCANDPGCIPGGGGGGGNG
jgi:hypothetical protein